MWKSSLWSGMKRSTLFCGPIEHNLERLWSFLSTFESSSKNISDDTAKNLLLEACIFKCLGTGLNSYTDV